MGLSLFFVWPEVWVWLGGQLEAKGVAWEALCAWSLQDLGLKVQWQHICKYQGPVGWNQSKDRAKTRVRRLLWMALEKDPWGTGIAMSRANFLGSSANNSLGVPCPKEAASSGRGVGGWQVAKEAISIGCRGGGCKQLDMKLAVRGGGGRQAARCSEPLSCGAPCGHRLCKIRWVSPCYQACILGYPVKQIELNWVHIQEAHLEILGKASLGNIQIPSRNDRQSSEEHTLRSYSWAGLFRSAWDITASLRAGPATQCCHLKIMLIKSFCHSTWWCAHPGCINDHGKKLSETFWSNLFWPLSDTGLERLVI